MSVRILYDIAGGKELEKALKDLRAKMHGDEGNLVAKALMKAAHPVWREAQARAPVSAGDVGAFTPLNFSRGGAKIVGTRFKDQPGRLRKAIKRKRHPNPRYLNELVGIGGESGGTRDDPTGAYYGHFVEFGTVKMGAQPFLRPAIESNRFLVTRIYGTDLGRGIEREGNKIGQRNKSKVTNNSRNRSRLKGRI